MEQEEEKNLGGRPTLFKTEYVEQARKLCELGATERELADFFEVSERTLLRWRNAHKELADAVRIGKERADARVEQSLYRKALGYSFDSVKIFQHQGAPVEVPYVEHVPPDTTACIFWLKNRKPKEWRDKVDHSHAGPDGGPVQVIQKIERQIVRANPKPADG